MSKLYNQHLFYKLSVKLPKTTISLFLFYNISICLKHLLHKRYLPNGPCGKQKPFKIQTAHQNINSLVEWTQDVRFYIDIYNCNINKLIAKLKKKIHCTNIFIHKQKYVCCKRSFMLTNLQLCYTLHITDILEILGSFLQSLFKLRNVQNN